MRKIPIKIIEVTDSVKIPVLANPQDAYIFIIGKQEEFEWKVIGKDKPKVTIKYKADGSPRSGKEIAEGDNGEVKKVISRGESKENTILYDIFVEGCALPIDPVIIVSRDPPYVRKFTLTTLVTLFSGVVLGLFLSWLFM